VRRLSAGSSIAQAAASRAAALATAFLRDGSREAGAERAFTHRDLNALFG
jgi:hypothetical protein